MIEASWLRAFSAFAEDANISRAARRLRLSQPAVHAPLRRLSAELGVTLGALLYVIGEGLRMFTQQRNTRLELLTADGAAAIGAVRSGLAHVGVAVVDSVPDDLEAHVLTSVGQVLVVRREHPLARRRHVSIPKLAGERLVLPPEGRPHRAMLEAAFRTHGTDIVLGATATGWELTVKLVELGFGVAVVNACCRVTRGLVTRPIRDLPSVRYAAFTRNRPRAEAAELVRLLVSKGDAWRDRARTVALR